MVIQINCQKETKLNKIYIFQIVLMSFSEKIKQQKKNSKNVIKNYIYYDKKVFL